MANIKSSAKRAGLIVKANERNKSARTLMKTNIKKFNTAVADGNRESAETAFRVASKTVDRAATKKLIHKNNAARKKSSMATTLSAMD